MYDVSVRYACGHAGGARVYNRQGRRDAESSAGGDICLECSQAEARRPALQGSRKQIAWARQVRAFRMGLLVEMAQRFEREWRAAGEDWAIVVFQRAREAVGNRASARWWIENRNRSAWALAIEAEPTLGRYTKATSGNRGMPPPAPAV